MIGKRKSVFVGAPLVAVLALAACVVLRAGGAWAVVQYEWHGALEDAVTGQWDLPDTGSCAVDPSKTTRPECLALRFPTYTTSATCTAGSGNPPQRSWSTGVCNDLVNNANQATCEAQPDRMWSNGICAVTMKGYDRNKAVCQIQLGGTWVTSGVCTGAWILPLATSYNPPLLISTAANPGAGDQCLRCHNNVTEYNSNRVRDVNSFLKTGHPNMSRKVTVGKPWAGPDGHIYPTDASGNLLDWVNGKITVGAASRDMVWIYDGWLEDPQLPTAIYKGPASTTKVCSDPRGTTANCVSTYGGTLINNAGASYSCGRCHTTGWTSDAAIANGTGGQPLKEPEKSFSGITWDRLTDAPANVVNLSGAVTGDPNKYSSWDQFGIVCSRCHGSAVENGGGGSCSVSGLFSAATCAAGGGAWSPAVGQCTIVFSNQTDCTNGSGTWDTTNKYCWFNAAGCTANGGTLTNGVCIQYSLTSWATCTAVTGGTWTSGLPSALGKSSHHNNMTSPDGSSGGYCVTPSTTGANPDVTFGSSNRLQCQYLGGTWYAQCSDPIWPTAQQCLDVNGCSNPAYATSADCTTTSHCTLPVYKGSAECTANGGAWELNGQCSVPFYTTSVACTAGGGSWTASNTWSAKTAGVWTGSSCSVGGGSCTKPQIVQASCTGGTLVYDSTAKVCTDTAYTTESDCRTHSGAWVSTWTAETCDDAGGKWTGFKKRRGPVILSLCMQCHRQETGGLPYTNGTCSNPTYTDPSACQANGGTWTETGNGLPVKVGPYHNTIDFVSHPHANEFMNSPHGQFTGKFSQIGSSTFGNGYNSYFQFEGESANTGNACTGCHNIHKSTVSQANPNGDGTKECMECHGKNLATMLHPKGTGTPLEKITTDPMEACETCHMPGGLHFFRINPDPTYSTFPSSVFTMTSGVTDAATAPDGNYTKAVWVDLDRACGQCHGGGVSTATTTGSITAASKVLTVANATGFAQGTRVTIAGAALVAGQPADFATYVASVSTNTITLVGPAGNTVNNATVVVNPTKNGAGYMTKTQLAGYAKGIHNDKPSVNFSYTLGTPNTLVVNLYALATCGGTCDAYNWDCGSGGVLTAPAQPAVTATCTYTTGGAKGITLTVEQFGVGSASATKIVNVYVPDGGPTASGTACNAIVHNDWTATLADTSTDDNFVTLVTVTWGDGSLMATGPQGTSFNHTYRGPGTYNVVQKALDGLGQQNIRTCVVTVPYFTISGTVFKSSTATWVGGTCTIQCSSQAVCEATAGANPLGCGGTWNATLGQCENPVGTAFPTYSFATSQATCTTVPSATVTVKDNVTGFPVKVTTTAANGIFSAGGLAPGTYNLSVTKFGYTFADPAAGPITLGGSSSSNNITATAP